MHVCSNFFLKIFIRLTFLLCNLFVYHLCVSWLLAPLSRDRAWFCLLYLPVTHTYSMLVHWCLNTKCKHRTNRRSCAAAAVLCSMRSFPFPYFFVHNNFIPFLFCFVLFCIFVLCFIYLYIWNIVSIVSCPFLARCCWSSRQLRTITQNKKHSDRQHRMRAINCVCAVHVVW